MTEPLCIDCVQGVKDEMPSLDQLAHSIRYMCGHGVGVPQVIEGWDSSNQMLSHVIVATFMDWMFEDEDVSPCSAIAVYTLQSGDVVALFYHGGNSVLAWNVCPTRSTADSRETDPQERKYFRFHSAKLLCDIIDNGGFLND